MGEKKAVNEKHANEDENQNTMGQGQIWSMVMAGMTEYHVGVTHAITWGQMQGKLRRIYPSMRAIADRMIPADTQSQCME